jgi:hypothetical protein
MREVKFSDELAALLDQYDSIGGVLEFGVFEPQDRAEPEILHRAAALEFIASYDRTLEKAAKESKEFPIERFWRLKWTPDKAIGTRVTFAEFWGTDDVESKQIESNAWLIPSIDGFKPAFFHPPYGLQGSYQSQTDLFNKIVTGLLGSEPQDAEIFSWSTDWSNYFDAGHEWWGAFYWTIRPKDSNRYLVIAASTTD